MFRRLLAVLTALVMFLVCLPVAANAEESFTITLDANGGYLFNDLGEQVDSVGYTVPAGSQFGHYVTAYSADEGKGFLGWSSTRDGEPAFDQDSLGNHLITQSETFYAVYSDYITVTLNANGGYFWGDKETTQLEYSIPSGRRVLSDYSTPTSFDENKAFAGWSHTPDGPVEITDSLYSYVTSVSETLYAVYTEAFIVTFDGNGGLVSGPYGDNKDSLTLSVAKGNVIGYYLRGYTEDESKAFVGWAYSPDGEPVFNENTIRDFIPESSVTLYAIWRDAYTITLNANGGYFWEEEMTEYICKVAQGATVSMGLIPHHKDQELGFAGWSHTPDGEVEIGKHDLYNYVPSASETLYAVWKVSYTITFDANGGYFYGTETAEMLQVPQGSKVETNIIPENSNPELAFAGWSHTPDGEVEIDSYDLYDYVPSASETLYAVWKASYTITLDANGGNFYGTETVETFQVPQGSRVDRNIIPEHTDPEMGFAGWSHTPDGEVEIEKYGLYNYVPAGNETLYAVWKASYTITLDANGGYFHDAVTIETITVEKGKPVNTNWVPVSKEPGKGFAGWSHTPDGEVEIEKYGLYSYVPAGNETLYAVYEDAYTITLNANGGYFYYADETERTIFVKKGSNMTDYAYPEINDPEKILGGWSRTPDGEVEIQELYNYTPTGDETLYAVWLKAYAVTLVTSEGYFLDEYGSRTDTQIFKTLQGNRMGFRVSLYSDDLHRAPAGFSYTENGEVDIQLNEFWNYVPESSTTLYAVWTEGYTVTFDANGTWFNVRGNTSPTVTQNIVKDGYILNYAVPVIPEGKELLGWSLTPDGEIIENIWDYPITSDITLYAIYGTSEEPETEPITIKGVTLELTGKIGLHFFLDILGMTEEEINDLTVVMEFNGETTSIPASAGVKRKISGQYLMMYESLICAAEMRDIVTLKVLDRNGNNVPLKKDEIVYTNGYGTTAAEYYERQEGSGNEPLKTLTRAMNNYGKYAQLYFDHNITDDVRNVTGVSDVTPETVGSYAAHISETEVEGLEYVGATASLDEAIGYRIYFKTKDGSDISRYTFTIDGTETAVKQAKGMYYVEVPDIPAAEMGDKKTIEATDGTNTKRIEYCALSYVQKKLTDTDTDEKLANLCRAIYKYYDATLKYFASVNQK